MSTRIRVLPFHPFCENLSWMTQELIEGYIFAYIKSEKHAAGYLKKWLRGDNDRMRLFVEAIADDTDYADLFDQIWTELELPAKGSIEFHIMEIERHLQNPDFPQTEFAKLYKILGEYRGWLTKPGEGVKINVTNLASNVDSIKTMTHADAERAYAALLSGDF